MFKYPSRYVILAGVVLLSAICLGAIAYSAIESTHPDKKVREGKVIQGKFVPQHEHHYMEAVYVGQTCRTVYTGSGTNQSSYQSCTPNYIYVPRTETIPDAWFITIQGCKRLKADSPLEYCEKPSKRTVRVDETSYHELKVGSRWHESPN